MMQWVFFVVSPGNSGHSLNLATFAERKKKNRRGKKKNTPRQQTRAKQSGKTMHAVKTSDL
jgi:thymidine kinase